MPKIEEMTEEEIQRKAKELDNKYRIGSAPIKLPSEDMNQKPEPAPEPKPYKPGEILDGILANFSKNTPQIRSDMSEVERKDVKLRQDAIASAYKGRIDFEIDEIIEDFQVRLTNFKQTYESDKYYLDTVKASGESGKRLAQDFANDGIGNSRDYEPFKFDVTHIREQIADAEKTLKEFEQMKERYPNNLKLRDSYSHFRLDIMVYLKRWKSMLQFMTGSLDMDDKEMLDGMSFDELLKDTVLRSDMMTKKFNLDNVPEYKVVGKTSDGRSILEKNGKRFID